MTSHEYPKLHHSLMHPCAGDEKACCGNHPNTPFLLRYESFFHSKHALLVLAYEVNRRAEIAERGAAGAAIESGDWAPGVADLW